MSVQIIGFSLFLDSLQTVSSMRVLNTMRGRCLALKFGYGENPAARLVLRFGARFQFDFTQIEVQVLFNGDRHKGGTDVGVIAAKFVHFAR